MFHARRKIAFAIVMTLLGVMFAGCLPENGKPLPQDGKPLHPPTVPEIGLKVEYIIRKPTGGLLKDKNIRWHIVYQIDSADGTPILIDGVPARFSRIRTFPKGEGTDTMLYGTPGIVGRLTYIAVARVPSGTSVFGELVSLPGEKAIYMPNERVVVPNDGKTHILEFKFALDIPTYTP